MPPQNDPFSPPASFDEHVRDALGQLANLRALSRHPLAARLGYSGGSASAGQSLRRELLSAVTSLKPAGCDRPDRAARLHQLLQLHYVHGMKLPAVAQRLGISLRQAYRDLKAACREVSEFLWFTHQLGSAPATANPLTTVGGHPIPTESVMPLLHQALQTLYSMMGTDLQPHPQALIIPTSEADPTVTCFVVVAVGPGVMPAAG